MKKFARSAVAAVLWWQVKRLSKKNTFKVVAVTGSIGKTSTKLAIAKVLSQSHKVQHQVGNYNDLVTVPLIFFGQELRGLFNPFAWLAIFWRNERLLSQKYPYDVVVIELGTDAPGQIDQFRRHLKIDIAVVTAITPEHMEFFPTLDAVAEEELAVAHFSHQVLVNKDLCPEKYLKKISNLVTYAVQKSADYQITNLSFKEYESSFSVTKGRSKLLDASHEHILEPQLYSVCAASAVADLVSMSSAKIEEGIRSIKPVSGRMNRLNGVNGSVIIDDTYNASPEAMKAALKTFYRLEAPHKIAILGNMNELGDYSKQAHEEIGGLCDPTKIDLVATIGPDANQYLAAAAVAKGCKVVSFDNPYTAGEYVKRLLKEDSLVLAKGSQNGAFAEEAVKLILANPADSKKLVRQSPEWLKKKKF